MSIQAECRAAMNQLALQGSLFTEIDVANAASEGKGWTARNFRQATERAVNVLRDAYMAGKLVRYGPVRFNGGIDYARRGAKIIYAHPEHGPDTWDTPNGSFPQLHVVNDNPQPGRKPDSLVMRDDSQSWREQDSRYFKVSRAAEQPPTPIPVPEPIAVAAVPEPQQPEDWSDERLDNLVDLLAERLEKRLEEPLTEAVRHKVAELLIA